LQAAQWLAEPVNRECNELLRRSLLIQSPLVLLGDNPPTPGFAPAANFPWRLRDVAARSDAAVGTDYPPAGNARRD
jgi:hypothetical protein